MELIKTPLTAPKAVLFDWDNTLVNTWPILHQALHKTFTQMGREPWSFDTVKARVSRSMRDAFPDIFGEESHVASEIYQQSFRDIHLEQLEAFNGSEEILRFLKDKGVYVAIVSNKTGTNLRMEVAHLGWNQYFSKTVGADDAARDKPAPDPVYAALEGSGISAGPDVWFVGDSPIDMETAHATGCVPIWYGELPDALVHPFHSRVGDHEDLAALLRRFFKAQD